MDVRSGLIQQDTTAGFRLFCEIIDELSNLLLKVGPVEARRYVSATTFSGFEADGE